MSSFRDPDSSPANAALLRPAVLILLIALSEHPRHGYRLLRDIEDITRGRIRLGTATIYHSLRRMCSEGLIEEQSNRGRSAVRHTTGRREYRITEAGRRAARAELERLAIVLDAAAQRGLLGGNHGEDRLPDPT